MRILANESISFLNGCDGHGVSAAWIGLEPNPDGTRDLAVVLHAGVKTEGDGREAIGIASGAGRHASTES